MLQIVPAIGSTTAAPTIKHSASRSHFRPSGERAAQLPGGRGTENDTDDILLLESTLVYVQRTLGSHGFNRTACL